MILRSFSNVPMTLARQLPNQVRHGFTASCDIWGKSESEVKAHQGKVSQICTDLNAVLPNPSDSALANFCFADNNALDFRLSTLPHHGVYRKNNTVSAFRAYSFHAAHQLPYVPEGHQCGRMHGHTFHVTLFSPIDLDDFSSCTKAHKALDQAWNALKPRISHVCLNDIKGLENPTSENLAAWIWRQLSNQVSLSSVVVYETASSGCEYSGGLHAIWKAFTAEIAHVNDVSLTGLSQRIVLTLEGNVTENPGWVLDFGEVKKLFKPLYDQTDHHVIEDIFEEQLTSIFLKLKPELADLVSIQISTGESNGLLINQSEETYAVVN